MKLVTTSRLSAPKKGLRLPPAPAEAVRGRRRRAEAAKVDDVSALAGAAARRPRRGPRDLWPGGVREAGHPVGDDVHGPVAPLQPAPYLEQRLGPHHDPIALVHRRGHD